MVLPGETIALGAPAACDDCGTPFVLEVLCSAAGWYIGTLCHIEGCPSRREPYTRESFDYYSMKVSA